MIRKPLWPVFLHNSTHSGTNRAPLPGVPLSWSVRAPLTGVLLCRSACQALKGAPWVGSYSVVQWSGVWWASLSIVQLLMLACGEKEAMVMAPPLTCDSSVSPCFHGCLVFLHWHFPRRSPPFHPLHLSHCSQQQPSPRDCSTIPKLQLLVTAPSRRPTFPPGVCMGASRTVWFSSHLGCHRSAVSALNASPLTQTIAPCGDWTAASVPPPAQGRSGPTNTPVFPPSCFLLLSFAWFCIFFSAGQVLLSTLSWCSACTSVSEGVFLMYPWRKIYSTSTYSSAILFSPMSLL